MMSKWAKEFEKSGAVSIGVDPGASDETLFNRYTRKDYSLYASLKGIIDTFRTIWRPNERNMTQTLTSVVCDPKFYDKEFNGKVFVKHSTENPWNNWNSESEPYLNMVMQEDIVSLLDNTASLWSDLEKRKSD